MLSAAVASLFLSLPGATTGFTCNGPYVPPTDFDASGNPITLEYAVGHAPKTAPVGVAEDRAKELLMQRLCSLSERSSCAPLEAKLKIWSTAEQGNDRCAMAVLRAPDVEAWRQLLAPDLDADLREVLAALIPPPPPPPVEIVKKKPGGIAPPAPPPKKKRAAVVVLGTVEDNGAPGGLRANWLLSHVRAALTELEVEMREAPKGWDGVRPPRDVELVIRGELIERVDPKKQLSVVDATFRSVDARGVQRAAKPISVPAAIAPLPPKLVDPPPVTQGLSVFAENREGGNLCPGDYTQVHVTNEIGDDLYVRVLDIDSDGEVLLLFPNETRMDDRVPGGKTISLSDDGFTVEGAPGGRERYLALASRTPDGLGAFQGMRGTCRFKPEDANRIIKGDRLGAIAFRAQGGFTFLDDVRCKKLLPIPDKALVAGALAQLPWCPPLP